MSNRMELSAVTFKSNEWVFQQIMTGMTKEHGNFRINDKTNEFGRIAGHIVTARHGLANMLDMGLSDLPWGEFGTFSQTAAFDAQNECPPLEDILKQWNTLNETFCGRLVELSEDVLNKTSKIGIPVSDPTTLAEFTAFLAMHEAYHLGQLGLLKKSITGKAPMSSEDH